ncbi:MAG: acyl-CoA thioesterase [candidate division GAL15 bacterium]
MTFSVRPGQTRAEVVEMVFPEHTNARGSLYGGRMMSWIVTAGTLAASRLARGLVVLGSMDELDFLQPVRAGEIVQLAATVLLVSRSSMEVEVTVHAEDPASGMRRPATRAFLAFVAVEAGGRPRPVGVQVVAADPEEERLQAEARWRRARRLVRIAQRRQPEAEEPPPRHHLETCRVVFPEDAITGNLMFAGRLLMDLDEVASVVAMRYARGPVVTASVDALDFLSPVRVGQIVHYRAALNYVGRSSMEVGVRVLSEDPFSGREQHTCSTFVTLVHTDAAGRPQPLPPYEPGSEAERRRFQQAEQRRRLRQERLRSLR